MLSNPPPRYIQTDGDRALKNIVGSRQRNNFIFIATQASFGEFSLTGREAAVLTHEVGGVVRLITSQSQGSEEPDHVPRVTVVSDLETKTH